MNQEAYRKLISGQSRGFGAGILRFVLGLAAMVYSVIIRLRNFLYEKGWLRAHRSNAIVMSIGNITVGGTGKTPLVIWVCKQIIQDSKFQIQNNRCAILTRGYKTRTHKQESGVEHRASSIDEPAILAEACPEAKVIVNPDRVAGAAEAVNKFDAGVLIMDDGFQHRRLARDVDIVTIDATQPFGFGRMFPAGLLREPVSALKRTDAVVVTRCDQVAEAELAKLEEKLKQMNPNMIVTRSIHAPSYVKYAEPCVISAEAGIQRDAERVDSCLRRNDSSRSNESVEQLKGKKIFAFCGIGNPEAFLNTIRGLGSEVVGSKIYNDHHHYTQDCLADIYEEATLLKADLVLTTQKDWTKIAALQGFRDDIPLAYLVIELRFLAGEDKLRALIEDALAGKILRE